MLNVNDFIFKYITKRNSSMFIQDVKDNEYKLKEEIKNKKVLVIGGAGTIGSSFIKSILNYEPSKLLVIDINENGLTELTRSLRSTHNLFIPNDYKTYPISYADPIFESIFNNDNGYDIVANFSAHKHVRSEKDKYSVQAMLENNVINAQKLLNLLVEKPPKHFFCVSTDKAANPVNIMGASKKIMEEMIMSYSDKFKITTARFANVAFSNGSLLAGFIDRLMNRQPIAAPNDVKRYFVSPEESGQICMLACILGENKQIFFPKLFESQMMTFSDICSDFLNSMNYKVKEFSSDKEARLYASKMPFNNTEYPVVFFKSDTTGEKCFEEFYVPGEELNMEKFNALGIINNVEIKQRLVVDEFLVKLKILFENNDFTKREIVNMLEAFIPNFQHEETGKNLDQKM